MDEYFTFDSETYNWLVQTLGGSRGSYTYYFLSVFIMRKFLNKTDLLCNGVMYRKGGSRCVFPSWFRII